ncbi:MAG TPA: sigma-54 dependent transcriptional regulator, partial [Spirochaetota bacterium]|nr:sigma-54 dependent transcriptional regulator [Spirochaetota bacterium]
QKLQSTSFNRLAEVHSKNFQKTIMLADQVAPYNTSILITGESGSGKEILARYIHKHSSRTEQTFLAINCSALPETLLESELCGHKAGAFTGANKDRMGMLEQAKGGTIFLDEIGEISPALQVKLLRIIQEKKIKRLGENHSRAIDVRFIAATNRNLAMSMQNKTFREDLYYRLAVFEIEVPPLRQRKDDILPLARYFIKELTAKLQIPELHLEAECLDLLLNYHWPGNVRELENALERAAVLSRQGAITPNTLPAAITRDASFTKKRSAMRSLAEVEKEYINTVMQKTGYKPGKAAKILGISPVTLWRKTKASQHTK